MLALACWQTATAFNILADVVGKTRPPKLYNNQLVSFQETRMTSSGMIMVVGNNGVMEFKVMRDIDITTVGEDTSVGARGYLCLQNHFPSLFRTSTVIVQVPIMFCVNPMSIQDLTVHI